MRELLTVILCVSMVAGCHAMTPDKRSELSTKLKVDQSDPYMMPYYTGKIVPTPQRVEYKDEHLSLDRTAIVLNGVKRDDPRLKYLLERIARYGGRYAFATAPTAEDTCAILVNDDALSPPNKPQGYAIKTKGKTISLKGNDFQGLLWAISSLNQMIFIKNGKTVVRGVNVADWPDTKRRGMLGSALYRDGVKWYSHFMVAFKFNVVDFRGYLPGKAYHLLDKGPHGIDVFDREKFYESLASAKKLLNPLKFEWYAGCWETSVAAAQKKDATLQFNCSSPKHFELFYNTIYKPVAEAGGNISMQLDDTCFPTHPDDIKRFGSTAKAHAYWLNKVYDKLKKINPNVKILFCPPFYWGPRSESTYPEDREEYLRTLSALPSAVKFYWTGPRVKGCTTKPSDVKWFAGLTGRKPVVFQNALGIPHIYRYHYGTDPIYNLKNWYYDGYLNDIDAYLLNGGDFRNGAVLVSIADWTWNTEHYDPEYVARQAVGKLMGPDAYPQLKKINQTLSFFDNYYSNSITPQAIKNAAKITAAYKRLKTELAALKKVTPLNNPEYWMGLSTHAVKVFAGRDLPRALKNPKINQYVKFADATRRLAEKESKFNPKRDIFRSALQFDGGAGPQFYRYKQPKKGIDVKRRFATWIYGAKSIRSSMSTAFEISPFPPSGDYKLIISGLDDDSEKKCPIKITLNGHTVFEGPAPFSNKNWTIHEFKLPADDLKRQNVLKIANTADSSSTSSPPFFMLNYAIIRDTTK